MRTAAAGPDGATTVEAPGSFRDRLLEGLAASIRERGFRETKISDIVRHARTSKRTFYAEFATKEACFVALLETTNALMGLRIAEAVDSTAPWRTQIRQAAEAYVDAVASEPELTLSWIRELPSLATGTGRQVQRRSMESIATVLIGLGEGEELRRAGVGPLSRPLIMLLLGGIRELTAMVVEDGGDVREITETVVEAATSLCGPRPGDAPPG